MHACGQGNEVMELTDGMGEKIKGVLSAEVKNVPCPAIWPKVRIKSAPPPPPAMDALDLTHSEPSGHQGHDRGDNPGERGGGTNVHCPGTRGVDVLLFGCQSHRHALFGPKGAAPATWQHRAVRPSGE